MDRALDHHGFGEVQTDEAFGVDGRPELRERDAVCEVGGSGREEIATMERSRDRVERVLGVGELVRLLDAATARCRHEQPVVRPDVQPTFGVAQYESPSRPAHAGIDDREVNADGHEADRVREHQRPLQDGRRRDPVGDVDDLRLRRDALDHAVAGAHEVVLQTEVAQEGDEHVAERNPGSRRELAAANRVSPAAVHRRATSLAAEPPATRPDPDERRRGLQRQWPRHHGRSIFTLAEGHASTPGFLRASSTSSAVSRCRRTSFAAMIAT